MLTYCLLSWVAQRAQLAAHTQPALRTGLMAPAWRLPHVFRRLILDLTWKHVPVCISYMVCRSLGGHIDPTLAASFLASTGALW